jgi:multidrug efflux system outer membrane protein
VWLRGMTNDVYFQIGLVTLLGLAAKNAILIVEYAVLKHAGRLSASAAAIEAARLRFRPILMTSLAFILGVLPLAISTGAGAGARHSVGTGVMGGMLAATFLAIFFVPLFFKLDLWGRYRHGANAARSELLATEYARATVRTAVAAESARAYFGLLAADAELALLRDTLKSREQTLALQNDLYQAGIIGDYDLQRAQAERAAVTANLAVAERAVGTYESALAAILGRSPREVFDARISRDVTQVHLLDVPEVPAGLPSDMLERRPDVKQVEAQLAAASLRIDAARTQYFPSLSLTASYGSESTAFADLFSAPALAWGIGASLLQPLIGLKAIEANVQAETARREAAVVSYVQTVQTAFRETRDALIANRTTRAALAAQAERAQKLGAALELAELRYRSGYSGYLDVLDAQRQLLQAQTLQILAARDVRFALIDLAKAMGGGWDYQAAPARNSAP